MIPAAGVAARAPLAVGNARLRVVRPTRHVGRMPATQAWMSAETSVPALATLNETSAVEDGDRGFYAAYRAG